MDLGAKIAKNAQEHNITTVRLLGSVKNRSVFMADDLLGTGGTLISAIRFLKSEGARQIVCAASLPLFSGPAIESFDEAYRDRKVTVDLDGVTFQEALDILARTNGLYYKVLRPTAVVISPDIVRDR